MDYINLAAIIENEKVWIVCQICCRSSILAPDRQQLRPTTTPRASGCVLLDKDGNSESARKAAVNRSMIRIANDKKRRRVVGEYVDVLYGARVRELSAGLAMMLIDVLDARHSQDHTMGC